MTRRLYHDDSHLRGFATNVTALKHRDGALWAALDATVFYPGGGGQPADRGLIADLEVPEVEESDGEIWHRIQGVVPAGERVECAIDWARRLDHMQQHTGQHILSRAFVETASADTRSFHLGDAVVTIDVGHPGPEPALLRQVEERANEIVWEDRAVSTHVVSRDEALRFPLRKPPDVEGPVRVVEVEGYDWSACGGTHVKRTGEVGAIAILSSERYKGGARISFVAGARVLRRLRSADDVLHRVCLEFTSGEEDLLNAVARLKQERERLERRLKPLLRDSLDREAMELVSGARRDGGTPVVARHFPGRDPDEVGQLASLVSARGAVGLFVSGGETPRAHFSAPAGTISVGALLADICSRHGGRGGGRPESAQGTIPKDQVDAALQAALGAAVAGTEKGTTA